MTAQATARQSSARLECGADDGNILVPATATSPARGSTGAAEFSAPAPEILIANPRLEFLVSYCKQSSAFDSNRKFFAVSYSALQALLRFRPSVTAPTFAACRMDSRATNHKSRVIAFLIETPRLEFPATPTKQSPTRISNRDTLAVLFPENPPGRMPF